MTYTPTVWEDGSAPPINAANLNKIEQGIVAAGQYRITRPNTDDRLVEVWNPSKAGGAGWSVVDYDSGWRNITSLAHADVTATSVYIRRLNSTVYWFFDVTIVVSGGYARVLGPPPTGFLPSGLSYPIYQDVPALSDSAALGLVLQRNTTEPLLSIYGGNAQPGTTWRGYQNFSTADAIPPSLPGSLYSPAPA